MTVITCNIVRSPRIKLAGTGIIVMNSLSLSLVPWSSECLFPVLYLRKMSLRHQYWVAWSYIHHSVLPGLCLCSSETPHPKRGLDKIMCLSSNLDPCCVILGGSPNFSEPEVVAHLKRLYGGSLEPKCIRTSSALCCVWHTYKFISIFPLDSQRLSVSFVQLSKYWLCVMCKDLET